MTMPPSTEPWTLACWGSTNWGISTADSLTHRQLGKVSGLKGLVTLWGQGSGLCSEDCRCAVDQGLGGLVQLEVTTTYACPWAYLQSSEHHASYGCAGRPANSANARSPAGSPRHLPHPNANGRSPRRVTGRRFSGPLGSVAQEHGLQRLRHAARVHASEVHAGARRATVGHLARPVARVTAGRQCALEHRCHLATGDVIDADVDVRLLRQRERERGLPRRVRRDAERQVPTRAADAGDAEVDDVAVAARHDAEAAARVVHDAREIDHVAERRRVERRQHTVEVLDEDRVREALVGDMEAVRRWGQEALHDLHRAQRYQTSFVVLAVLQRVREVAGVTRGLDHRDQLR